MGFVGNLCKTQSPTYRLCYILKLNQGMFINIRADIMVIALVIQLCVLPASFKVPCILPEDFGL